MTAGSRQAHRQAVSAASNRSSAAWRTCGVAYMRFDQWMAPQVMAEIIDRIQFPRVRRQTHERDVRRADQVVRPMKSRAVPTPGPPAHQVRVSAACSAVRTDELGIKTNVNELGCHLFTKVRIPFARNPADSREPTCDGLSRAKFRSYDDAPG